MPEEAIVKLTRKEAREIVQSSIAMVAAVIKEFERIR
jgi:hypothetical protein